MMTLGPGVQGHEAVRVGRPYLGRMGDRYLVIVPFCPKGTTREEIPYTEAEFIDPLKGIRRDLSWLSEIAPIY